MVVEWFKPLRDKPLPLIFFTRFHGTPGKAHVKVWNVARGISQALGQAKSSVGGDDFDACLFELVDEVSRGLGIGDDGVDYVEFTEGGDGAAIKLGVVQAKNDSLRRLEHCPLDVDQ